MTNNNYKRTLRPCFERHTLRLLHILAPDVVLHCGKATHRFAGPDPPDPPPDPPDMIPMMHYAHRKGRDAELEELERVRTLLAQTTGRSHQ